MISPQGCAEVMEILHETHPGASRLKILARSYVWWPCMDETLEERVKSCTQCQELQKAPAKAPLHPWEFPSRPWSRLHAYFAGLILSRMFLVIVDAHFKWLEIMRWLQLHHRALSRGWPHPSLPMVSLNCWLQIMNGSVFTSSEFEEFLQRHGIRHVTSSPYHPATNGLAEKAVQTFKMAMKKLTSGSIQSRLQWFLSCCQITPHATTGRSPAELLMGRQLRSTLDLVHPDLNSTVRRKQERQKQGHDVHSKYRSFQMSEPVLICNFTSRTPKWLPGPIVKTSGPLSHQIQLECGGTVRRHQDHIRSRLRAADKEDEFWNSFQLSPEITDSFTPPQPPAPQLRRSQWERRPPDRYSPSS